MKKLFLAAIFLGAVTAWAQTAPVPSNPSSLPNPANGSFPNNVGNPKMIEDSGTSSNGDANNNGQGLNEAPRGDAPGSSAPSPVPQKQ